MECCSYLKFPVKLVIEESSSSIVVVVGDGATSIALHHPAPPMTTTIRGAISGRTIELRERLCSR